MAPDGTPDALTFHVQASEQSLAVGRARDVYFYAASPSRQSRLRSGWREYMEQVRDIAPREGLIGRESELAQMAAFCAGPEPYRWWRADAWAGKSALMSSFALNPPPGVIVVSFFVTARYASQDDSTAFTAALLRQFEELLDLDLPDQPPGEGPDSAYRLLLMSSARQIQEQGHRLVLVVDGLDEDRGPSAGIASIASQLPKQCDHGLKVIVAGRPHPTIPWDVPADHPLRDPGIVHYLTQSEHARVIRDIAELELQNLLNGSPAMQDLLGLITAAGGGLTRTDLADLTGLAPFEINRILRGVTGRTFATRATEWATSDGEASAQVYLLAHETLQEEATEALGERRLAGFRNTLHTWADAYRASGWPDDTPVYLQRGYFRMLLSVGDLTRLIACAMDAARHDQMLKQSGADEAALAEIAVAQNTVLDTPNADLITLARLALHRDDLAARNTSMPVCLASVWGSLGQYERAAALARTLIDPIEQARATAELAAALATAGQLDRAEAIAQSIEGPSWQARALAEVAAMRVANGQPERAEAIARSVTGPYWQARVLADLAIAVAAAQEPDRAGKLADDAERLARSLTDPDWRAQALGEAAGALAAAGQQERALAIAQSLVGMSQKATMQAEIARALAMAGQYERAEAEARSITYYPYWQSRALADVAGALAAAERLERAEGIARSIEGPSWKARAFADVAQALAAAGQPDRAATVANDCRALISAVADPGLKARVLAEVAGAMAIAGQAQAAESMISALADLGQQAQSLAEVARALAAAGQHEQSRKVASGAESLAHLLTEPAGGHRS